MAKYYISFETMKLFGAIQPDASVSNLVCARCYGKLACGVVLRVASLWNAKKEEYKCCYFLSDTRIDKQKANTEYCEYYSCPDTNNTTIKGNME